MPSRVATKAVFTLLLATPVLPAACSAGDDLTGDRATAPTSTAHDPGARDATADRDEPDAVEETDAATTPEADAKPPTADAGMFGASRCNDPQFKLCDDFESAAVGAAPSAPWKLQIQNASSYIKVDDTRAARGKRSLHVHTANTGFERAMFYETSTFPAKNNAFYGRAFVYVESPLPQAHWTHLAGLGNVGGKRVEVRYGGQFTHLLANYYGNDQYQHAGKNVNGQWTDETKLPRQRWSCMEWMFDGRTNEMRMWLDDAEVPRMHVKNISTDCCQNDPWVAPAYDRLQLGWEIYSNQDTAIQSHDVWYDEVAIGEERIGCTR